MGVKIRVLDPSTSSCTSLRLKRYSYQRGFEDFTGTGFNNSGCMCVLIDNAEKSEEN